MVKSHMEISYDKMFQRNIGLFTPEMQEVLRKGTVAVGGTGGGPGSNTAVFLARSGVGHLKIADPDIYENHNIVRQHGAMASTLGRNKTDVMEELLKDINPFLKIDCFRDGVRQSNMEEFLDGADVVVDSIDYSAPRDKREMYKLAREKNLYVLSGPVAGLGTLAMCFAPDGMTMEEAFSFPENEDKIDEHKIPLGRLIGCELDYISPLFFKTREMNPPYWSTTGTSCAASAAINVIDAIKILFLREREKNPGAFPHLNEINLVEVPYVRRIDLWDTSKSGIVNMMDY